MVAKRWSAPQGKIRVGDEEGRRVKSPQGEVK